jgi:hypothetical protein
MPALGENETKRTCSLGASPHGEEKKIFIFKKCDA